MDDLITSMAQEFWAHLEKRVGCPIPSQVFIEEAMRAAWAVAAAPTGKMVRAGAGQVPVTGHGDECHFAVDIWQAMHGAVK